MKIRNIVSEMDIAQLPGVRAPSSAFGGLMAQQIQGAARELSASGEQWMEAARREQTIEKKQQEIERNNWTLIKTNDLRGDMDNIHREIERFSPEDYDKIPKYWDEQSRKLSQKYFAEAQQKGKEYEQLWIHSATPLLTSAELKAREIKDKKWLDKAAGDRIARHSIFARDISNDIFAGKDYSQKAAYFEALEKKDMSEGLITSAQYQKDKASLASLIDANVQKLKQEEEKQREKAAESNADLVLSQKYGTDYEKIISDLGNPEEYQRLGLTAERAANLSNIVRNRQVRENQVRDAAQEETAKAFSVRLRNNELSHEMVKEAIEMGSLDYRVGNAFDKALEEQIKALDGKIKTDPGTYARLLSRAWDDPDKEAVKKDILANVHLLEQADVEKLLGHNESKAHGLFDSARSQGATFLRNTVIPKRGMMAAYLSTPQEEEDLANALKAYDNALDAARKTGKVLTRDDVLQVAKDTAATYSKSLAQRITDFTRYTVEQMKKKPEPAAPKAGMLNRQDEESFMAWYKQMAQKTGLNQNPDDPQHFYDWRSAWKSGIREPDKSGHWPSKYKIAGHPREVIEGVNTRTGEKVYEATATNPQTGEKIGYRNGKWETIPK